MPAPEGGPSPHRWNQIRKLPHYPAIRTLHDYEQSVTAGTFDALDYLRGIEPLRELSIADLQQVHHLIFKGVHPWAGQFRLPGQMSIIASLPAADPQRIVRELGLALVQTQQMQDNALAANDPHHLLAALAFFHVRFERVHPFLDGNGRTGRTILAVQVEKAFGTLPTFADRAGYRKAMKAADTGDLAHLINYFCISAGLRLITRSWPASFKIPPRFLDEDENDPTFIEDLSWSRIVS